MSRLRFCLLVTLLYSCLHLGYGESITLPPNVIIDIPKSSLQLNSVPVVTDVQTEKAIDAPKQISSEPSNEASKEPESPIPKSNGLVKQDAPVPPAVVPQPSNDTPKEPAITEDSTQTKSTDSIATDSPVPPSPSPSPSSLAASSPTSSPAPTPKPGPFPPPEQGMWYYKNTTNNETCIIVQFAAQLNVSNPKMNGNDTSTDVLMNVPTNASVTEGSCGPIDQWLTISWTVQGTNVTNNMTLVFHKNETTKDYLLKSLNISLTPELFNTSSDDAVEFYHGVEWKIPLSTSYKCTTPTRFNMTSDTPSTIAALTLSRLQEEAFRSASNHEFSAARECGGGDLPDAVPIAVGCALGGLVLVVLIAYMVARKRSPARGYLSM